MQTDVILPKSSEARKYRFLATVKNKLSFKN